MNEKEIQDAVDYFTETKDNFNSDTEHYVQILIQAITDLNEKVNVLTYENGNIVGLEEEISTLAYENKAMAKNLEELGYDVESLIFKHREG